ncbi:RteC domain-containing protein [Pedobacter ghigonis]|uniref:RteC domain-containing protein n=1 Tax=Pedobacter ghigonis TaxID=2730403 RepID=UPI001589D6A0|nr:RteC domain-containing protein [Pedobacter ghigonis]
MKNMIKKLSADLYQQMKADLDDLKGSGIPKSQMLRDAILIVQKYLDELKALVDANPFLGEEEEIWFFKIEKPRFYRWLIFYTELFAIDNTKPIIGKEEIKEHYNDQMRYINRFFRSHEFHYQYFRLDSNELDRLYFIRGASPLKTEMSLIPRVDPSFGTGHEFLFSNFRAYEMLQRYLSDQLTSDVGIGLENQSSEQKGKKFAWTGDQVNLIEMIYGLWLTGQFNNGKADLSDIVAVLQNVFQVNLGQYFRRFSEIKQRKGMSKTRFLDQMRDALQKKIFDWEGGIAEK